MKEVVIVAACRTAVGKFGGTLAALSDIDFGPIPIKEVIKRAGLTGDQIDEVIYASGYRTGDLPINSARVVAVKAGIPQEKPQFTISKACAGSIKAVTLAAQVIKSGDADIIVAGGMESMSNATFMLKKARWGYRLGHGQLMDQLILFDPLSGNTMGETAENVAEKYNVSREDQDEFGLRSQQLTEKAITEGKFKEQIVPVEIPQRKGEPKIFDTDEHPRFGTTIESLQRLKPPFRKGGSVTAGSSSGMNDGASALVVMSKDKADELGLSPMASIVSYASAGVDPAYMGIGPIPATKMALEKAGLTMDDMDLIELNEAFASQALACVRELNMDMDKVNVNGGAIALGHPVSASGGVILTKLLYEMEARDLRYGLATLCIGGGQGMALIVERKK
ncbi:MAG: acetyl-CoA C-acyltransferase [Deltaproteobacteria bacterium]|nr:MAG: acetyl-CoA C-acyltransferase [Deltaproteobacteria bacterium]RLC21954.1 MAG: acetyl-CoA C-acyltransferase [Deltaproteobacteria bacterium]